MSAITFDPRSGVLTDGERTVSLAPLESVVFRALCQSRHVMTINALITEMYRGTTEPDWSQTIPKILIHRIRHKIQRAEIPVVVRTVWGCGYQSASDVTLLDAVVEVAA